MRIDPLQRRLLLRVRIIAARDQMLLQVRQHIFAKPNLFFDVGKLVAALRHRAKKVLCALVECLIVPSSLNLGDIDIFTIEG